MKTMILAMVVAATTVLADPSAATADEQGAVPAASEREALAHWDRIFEVFSHPRCANCHVPEDNRPRWSGPSFGLAEGEWMYHGMNIDGGESRDGADAIPCAACHATSNSELPHGPPGASVWLSGPGGNGLVGEVVARNL